MDYKSLPTYPSVELAVAFQDERGIIQNLVTDGVASVVLITSKAGTQRANHWHREDDHLCYVVQGGIDYHWQHLSRDHGGRAPMEGAQMRHFGAGDAFYTPPFCAHTMYFTDDTVFVVMSRRSRAPAEYEEDLVRVPSLRVAPPPPSEVKPPAPAAASISEAAMPPPPTPPAPPSYPLTTGGLVAEASPEPEPSTPPAPPAPVKKAGDTDPGTPSAIALKKGSSKPSPSGAKKG